MTTTEETMMDVQAQIEDLKVEVRSALEELDCAEVCEKIEDLQACLKSAMSTLKSASVSARDLLKEATPSRSDR